MKLCALKGWDTDINTAYSSQSIKKVDVLLDSNGDCIYYSIYYSIFYLPYKTLKILTYIIYGSIPLFILVYMCCNGGFRSNNIVPTPVPVPVPNN